MSGPSVCPLYQLPGSGKADMWRQTLGSSSTPGQPLMAQEGLNFQSGRSHEVLRYPWPAQSSPGPVSRTPCRCVRHCRLLHHAALRLELPGPGGSHPSSSSSLTSLALPIRIKPPISWGSPRTVPGPGDWVFSQQGQARIPPHDMCATWHCRCLLLLLLSHSPALCCAAGPPVPIQPTPKKGTLQHLLPLVGGAGHGILRC